MEIEALAIAGLGNTTYLLASGGEAVAVDPPRDAWRLAEAADARGWTIRHVVETHVHNDYLSGARELRRSRRALISAPARGGYRFPVRSADEGFRIELGQLALVARSSPGHTPEHIAWEVREAGNAAERPVALFSGGSLLMAGVGRTDLLGPSRTAELTAAQYRTLRRLAELPDEVMVYPTHGAGSFCVAGPAGGPMATTIGALRLWNPAFAAGTEQAFEALLAEGRTRYPTYYRRMAPLNRRGPRLLGGPPAPPALTAQGVARAAEGGAWVVDVRPPRAFARRHVQGALNIDVRDSFAAYVGWLLPFDAPIVLVSDDEGQADLAATELARIGYDRVVGFLGGGVEAWAASGRAVASYPAIPAAGLRDVLRDEGPAHVLDVRQPSEWREGVIPGSHLVFVADLPDAIPSLARDAAWTVACKAGTRAGIAASLLDAAGIPVRLVVGGGVPSLPAAELAPAAA